MYFTNINDAELSQYHKTTQISFKMEVMDILGSNMFKKEAIITNSIYKIYPLFYCEKITSSNNNIKILDNKCIICIKEDDVIINFITPKNYTVNTLNATYKLVTNGCCGCIYNENLEPIKDVKITLIDTSNNKKSVKTDDNGLFYITLNNSVYRVFAYYNDLTLRII